jgi:hypothetical protein
MQRKRQWYRTALEKLEFADEALVGNDVNGTKVAKENSSCED